MPDLVAARRARAGSRRARTSRIPRPARRSSPASAPPLLARAFGLLFAGGAADRGVGRRAPARRRGALRRRPARTCSITNGGLNPTTESRSSRRRRGTPESAGSAARVCRRPLARLHEHRRSRTARPTWQIPAEAHGRRGAHGAQRAAADGALRLASARSVVLRPAVSLAGGVRSDASAGSNRRTPRERAAFLRRSGVRRCVLPADRTAAVPRRRGGARTGTCASSSATRVRRACSSRPSVDVARDPVDLAWQREALFDPALPDDVARLAVMPATCRAAPGTPEPPAARIVQDGATTRGRRGVGCAQPGMLVLRDSYDPSWTRRGRRPAGGDRRG